MEGSKFVVAETYQKNLRYRYALILKCWDKEPNSLMVSIFTPNMWQPAATYPKFSLITFKVDNNEKIPMIVAPVEHLGRLSYRRDRINSASTEDLLKQIMSSKKLIAAAVDNTILEFPVPGAAKAAKEVGAICGLTP